MHPLRTRVLIPFAVVALVATACSASSPAASAPPATSSATLEPSFAPMSMEPAESMMPGGDGHDGPAIEVAAASATITVDGDDSDWEAIEGTSINLEQLRLDGLNPSDASEIKFDPVDPVDVTFKVASDDENIYVLLEVPGGFVYDAANHNLSPAVAVMFLIEDSAEPHMGAEEPEIHDPLGMVDIWHWELDCAPGTMSGGAGIAGGDDPACNLDDEYSTTPWAREDDGGGDAANDAADNSLIGSWDHTARASGAGADGVWVFEFARPLSADDPQDAQFASGGTAHAALAFFDPTEGVDGWSDAGHLQSAYNGWIEVTLP